MYNPAKEDIVHILGAYSQSPVWVEGHRQHQVHETEERMLAHNRFGEQQASHIFLRDRFI